MNLGHGHRRSVLILWTWTALLSAFVLYPVLSGENPTYLPFGMAADRHRAVHGAAPEGAPGPPGERQRHGPREPHCRACARRLAAGPGEVGVALGPDASSSSAALRRRRPTPPRPASRRPRRWRRRPRPAPRTAGPPGSSSTFTGRSTDVDDGAHVLDREQPGRVQHVGAGLLVRLQAADRVGEVAHAADQVLGPRR